MKNLMDEEMMLIKNLNKNYWKFIILIFLKMEKLIVLIVALLAIGSPLSLKHNEDNEPVMVIAPAPP